MNSDHSFILQYKKEGGEWKQTSLVPGEFTIGRSVTNNLLLDDSSVSNRHARLSFQGNDLWLTDLGSTNGTQLDGLPLPLRQRVPILPGQTFSIGRFTLVIRESDRTKIVQREPEISLWYQTPSQSWQVFPLLKPQALIGRSTECDIQLVEDGVSRRHAVVLVQPDGIRLTDLETTNGTLVDGISIPPNQPVLISPGQFIQIGACTLKVETTIEPTAGIGSMPEGMTIMLPSDVASKDIWDSSKTMIAGSDVLEHLKTQVLDLESHDRITIGRSSENLLVLDHPQVSSFHAILEKMGTRHRIIDTRSTNGVYVNNQLIEKEAYLRPWDEVRIGPYGFVMSGNQLQIQPDRGLTVQAWRLHKFVSKDLNLLKDISFYIRPMEFVALVGMSGAGKTTLLNAICGYTPATHGQVSVNGTDLYHNYNAFRNDIGYVPQRDIVHQELTPEQALDYAAQLRMPVDISPEERYQRVKEVLADLDLTERKDVLISSLSGGQLKRVSIGVELLTKPRLFFLDEPTSGLDPGTEYEMMKLLRRLADQGRTVVLVTHATKNVMMCDKVIFLARGGFVAFYGPPEDALEYFDQYRTERERREKSMEFDDIYRVLGDVQRGSPPEWDQRFRASPSYQSYVASPPEQSGIPQQGFAGQPDPRQAQSREREIRRISALQQFFILSARNLKIIYADKVSLRLMLILAPLLGAMDFVWGTTKFDPVIGKADKAVATWFVFALIAFLLGSLSSVREIVKENEIYKRERAITLKVLPYVFSKIWIGIVLAIYQSAVLMVFRIFIVKPDLPGSGSIFMLFITLFLATTCGYLTGLAVSAIAPNQNASTLILIAVVVPQFLFAGLMTPLKEIPGGNVISIFTPTRWSFEAFVRINQLGDKLGKDPCWELPLEERQKLTEDEKKPCPCMGANLFENCTGFPGLLSPNYYDKKAQIALSQPEPIEPDRPTQLASPTPLATFTPFPSPTPIFTPTPFPTPVDPRLFSDYMNQQMAQSADYQQQILNGMDEYSEVRRGQGEEYAELTRDQGQGYADASKTQGDQYSDQMEVFSEEMKDWSSTRQKAIGSAETMLSTFNTNYEPLFKGPVSTRWLILFGNMIFLTVVILVFQKRKDVI